MGRFRQSLPGKTQLDSNILYYSIRLVFNSLTSQ